MQLLTPCKLIGLGKILGNKIFSNHYETDLQFAFSYTGEVQKVNSIIFSIEVYVRSEEGRN